MSVVSGFMQSLQESGKLPAGWSLIVPAPIPRVGRPKPQPKKRKVSTPPPSDIEDDSNVGSDGDEDLPPPPAPLSVTIPPLKSIRRGREVVPTISLSGKRQLPTSPTQSSISMKRAKSTASFDHDQEDKDDGRDLGHLVVHEGTEIDLKILPEARGLVRSFPLRLNHRCLKFAQQTCDQCERLNHQDCVLIWRRVQTKQIKIPIFCPGCWTGRQRCSFQDLSFAVARWPRVNEAKTGTFERLSAKRSREKKLKASSAIVRSVSEGVAATPSRRSVIEYCDLSRIDETLESSGGSVVALAENLSHLRAARLRVKSELSQATAMVEEHVKIIDEMIAHHELVLSSAREKKFRTFESSSPIFVEGSSKDGDADPFDKTPKIPRETGRVSKVVQMEVDGPEEVDEADHQE